MPFSETDAVKERKRMIEDWLSGRFKKTELASAYSVSRPTLDLWIGRFKEGGFPGLEERSRAPHHCPHRTSAEVEELVVATRKRFPHWGPKKLKAFIENAQAGTQLPAASTIGDILHRHGLVEPRKRRRKSSGVRQPVMKADAPNEVWCADFKGEFRVGDGQYCYPLTITDGFSRFLLECRALESTAMDTAFEVFEAVFRTYGVPQRMRTDNGVPFSSPNGLCGLSQLSVWWLKLGILPELIQPGRPDQNGRHERMHRTLKAETTRPPQRQMQMQQDRFDAFREEYNELRPHEALGQTTPASSYEASTRPFPDKIGDFEYPMYWEGRRVGKNGHIKLKGHHIFLSYTLAGERVGLKEVDDGRWDIHAGPLLLGRFDQRDDTFTPLQPGVYIDELERV